MYARLGLLTALLIFASDLATKWFVANIVMNPPRVIEVLPFFNLTLGFNRGLSFGLLNSESPAAPYLLSMLAFVMAGFLFVWLRRSKHAVEAAAIGAIIGGALANAADRLADGSVTDFLDFYIGSYHWPAFNLADAAISCGVVFLIVGLQFGNRDR